MPTTSEYKKFKKEHWYQLAQEAGADVNDTDTIKEILNETCKKLKVNGYKELKTGALKTAVYQAFVSKHGEPKFLTAGGGEESAENTESTEKEAHKTGGEPKDEKVPLEVIEEMKAAKKEHYIAVCNQIGIIHDRQQSAEQLEEEVRKYCEARPPLQFQKFDEEAWIDARMGKGGAQAPETPAPAKSNISDEELEEIKQELTKLGVAFAGEHTPEELQNLLNMVKGSGVTAPASGAPKAPGDNFELTADNADAIASTAPSAPAPAPTGVGMAPAPVGVPSQQQTTPEQKRQNLNLYHDIILGHVNSYWRAMEKRQIHDFLSRDSYPFTYKMVDNPQNVKQVAIYLTIGSEEIRVPKNESQWIETFG